MPDISARLSLPYLLPSQAQKHVTHNEALALLDLLVQTGVEAFGATNPPANPTEGAVYALGSGPAGDWAGQDDMLAFYRDGAWIFTAPQPGWRAWDIANAVLMVFHDGGWISITPELTNLDGVGIGTAWDATNRLALASDASLFSHAGAGHQLKVNKSSGSDTASLLFQSNWTGHAEMGLAGDTDFSIKVSDDGIVWTEALRADAASGILSGAAIQQSADDTTTGRLMRADYGYGPGNLLGAVSQSGGTPTGAVIESGSNANGRYVRYADGTQICWLIGDLTFNEPRRLAYNWTFPMPFDVSGSNALTIHTNLRNEFGATPSPEELTGPFARQGGSQSGTDVNIRLYRIEGMTNFNAADTIPFDALAVGRWY
jgi:hypothetical protein